MKAKRPCRVCGNLPVQADAGILRSIPYLYCRTCRVEVDDRGNPLEAGKEPSSSSKSPATEEGACAREECEKKPSWDDAFEGYRFYFRRLWDESEVEPAERRDE